MQIILVAITAEFKELICLFLILVKLKMLIILKLKYCKEEVVLQQTTSRFS